MANREEAAIGNFEMISSQESKIRRIIGRSLMGIATLLYLIYGVDTLRPGFWTVLVGAGIMLEKMGRDSQ